MRKLFILFAAVFFPLLGAAQSNHDFLFQQFNASTDLEEVLVTPSSTDLLAFDGANGITHVSRATFASAAQGALADTALQASAIGSTVQAYNASTTLLGNSTTGSGAIVRVTSPTLVTPVLGAATATSINGLTISASTGTLTLANGKTLTASNTLTFSGTDGSTLNVGGGGTLGALAFASTSGASILKGNGSGSVGNVTIGSGLAFDGTTLSASSSYDASNVAITGGTVSGLTSLATTGAAITSTRTSLGTTTATGLLLTNTTAATSGNQQVSPALSFIGQGWKTTSTAASQSVDFSVYNLPVQGTTAPTGILTFTRAINGGSTTDLARLYSQGWIQATGGSYDVPCLIPAADTGTGIGSGGAGRMHFIANTQPIVMLSFSGGVTVNGNYPVRFTGGGLGNSDGTSLEIWREADAVLQLGSDSATPIAQKIKVPDGSGTNIAGAQLTIAGGNGTGSGVGGSINLNTTPAGSSGSSQNTSTARLAIDSAGVIRVYNSDAAPGSSPASGGYLYSEGGALKWRSEGGTVTTIAPN